MRSMGRQERHGVVARGVVRAALMGVARRELIQEAVQFLLASTKVDRIGVWMESAGTERAPGRGFAGFRGVVADRHGQATPSEWERLSPEAPLPVELLDDGKSAEQELSGASDQLILGVLVELRRAVWVPVQIAGRLCGVLFAGVRKKHGALPVPLLESFSMELALAVELDEERRNSHRRLTDINSAKHFLDELASSGPTDAVLTRLMDSCTETGTEGDGLGAAFAVLHARDEEKGISLHGPLNGNFSAKIHEADLPYHLSLRANERCALSWQSGDPAWLHALESQPLADIWQRAQEAHSTVAVRAGAGTAWPRGDVSRVVAIGLQAAGESVGVLVAGFREETSSQAAIERLQSRTGLATTALVLRERNHEAVRHEARQNAVLLGGSAATILVDEGGAIVGLSRGARELLSGRDALGERQQESRWTARGSGQAPKRKFVELFHIWEQPRVQGWLQSLQAGSSIESGIDAPQVELRRGQRGQLRYIQSASGLTVVSLERLAVDDTGSRRGHTEAQLVQVIEWLEEGVVLFDAQHSVLAMNSRFAQIVGLAPEEAGRVTTLNRLITRLADHAAEPEKFATRWRELACGLDTGAREEIQLLRPVPRMLERVTRPVLDAAGQRIGRVEIYRDLTAQCVLQSKLLHTEKLAALGQMVTGVAHELSNPLTSILGYAQRLFLRSQTEGSSDEVRQIFQEAERASMIVRRLLLSARESRPERRKVSLNQVVSRAMDLQKIRLASEQVTVELDLDETLPLVLGDAGQLQQVLMNLIGNARQAIEQRGKGGIIRLNTKCIDSGRSAQLEISDDGPGIPPAIAARIFDPFFTTKPAGIGTGLGLAIVLGVVREHGGEVNVASPPGGGAMFTLQFPAAPADQARTPPVLDTTREPKADIAPAWQVLAAAQRLPLTGAAGPAPKTATRVLVVEDEPTVARLISDVLEDEGFQVEALLDGYEALERAARASYDLVICDMKMPGLDGQHFYETLACMGSPLSKRFLFVTGDVLSSHTQEFLERHNLPHVAKPFRVEELTEKVRRVLAEARPNDPSCEPPARTNAAST
jgi:signal transduction histidine kinase/ActR/RegA family two-component response regulator